MFLFPEVCELREALVAEVAGERPLAGVDEGVALQLGRRREVLAAVVARVHASPLPVMRGSPSGLEPEIKLQCLSDIMTLLGIGKSVI